MEVNTMDPIQQLQQTLEESLLEMNKDAMKKLAAQIAATVSELQNGDPSKVMLMWEAGNEPEAIKQFIAEHWKDHYTYSVLLPLGRAKTDLELARLAMVELDLPQNKLLLYYRP
jgi:hypothetical protein